MGKGEDTNKFIEVWSVIPGCMDSKVRKHSMRIPNAEVWPWWSLERRKLYRTNVFGKEGYVCV
jgi:hypothetical protein